MNRQLSAALRIVDGALARRFAVVSIAALAIAGLDVVGILLLVPLLDSLEAAGSAGRVSVLGELGPGTLILLVVSFFISKSITMALLRWWTTGVVLDASSRTASALYERYMRAPVSFHEERNSSESVRTLSVSVRTFYDQGVMGMANGAAESATLIVLAGLLVYRSPAAGFAAFVYFFLGSYVFLRFIQRRTRANADAMQALGAQTVQLVQEGLGGLKELRVRGTEAQFERSFTAKRQRQEQAKRLILFAGEVSRYYLEVLFIGAFGVITMVALRTEASGEVLQTLTVVLAIGFRVLPSISRTLLALNKVKVGQAALEVLISELDGLKIPTLGIAAPSLPARQSSPEPAELQVNSLSFSYENGPTVLRDVTMTIPPGSSVGIAGTSGAGKTTFISLLCGLRDPREGSILIGRLPPARCRIGYVPQEVFVLDATIRENVAFGLEASDVEIWEALDSAQLGQFVSNLELGLDTVVGESGARLSGGQRQRLGLARALLGGPSLLLLDEATAALDLETEAGVVQAIEALHGTVTVVVVAHRLSTIRGCDLVAYFADGTLGCLGTFDDVRAQVPEFARAVELLEDPV